MKRLQTAVVILLFLALPLAVLAQFTSGSNGSYGAINITATGTTTLAMPPDGIFHCTTINIVASATLTFTKNARNTPVYLLATGDVTINGNINVSGNTGTTSAGGAGGPGGFDGGQPGFGLDTPPGSGNGPGGGNGGENSFSDLSKTVGGGAYGAVPPQSPRAKSGVPYGSRLLIPLVGGSGGGGTIGSPGKGGGGGGGAILIASNTKISLGNNADIFAEGGGSNGFGEGSGGAVRLVAPRVDGNGNFDVSTNYGGSGRTRVDCLDRSGMNITGVQALGGVMLVFPEPLPKLTIISAAGTAIPDGSTAAVSLILPTGTPTAQQVTVRARDFGQSVPIRVAVIPDSSDAIYYDTTINNSAANPADTTVNVTLPVNVQVRIQVWTR